MMMMTTISEMFSDTSQKKPQGGVLSPPES